MEGTDLKDTEHKDILKTSPNVRQGPLSMSAALSSGHEKAKDGGGHGRLCRITSAL